MRQARQGFKSQAVVERRCRKCTSILSRADRCTDTSACPDSQIFPGRRGQASTIGAKALKVTLSTNYLLGPNS